MKTAILKANRLPGISTLVLAVMLTLSEANAATLGTQLDRHSVSPGDTVTLSINLPADGNAQPDLAPLQQDFDILGTGTSSQFQNINGKTSQSKQLNIRLAPHRNGQLTIPALKVGSDETAPLQLTVRDAPIADNGKTGRPVWVEMETGLPASKHDVTVQQEIPVTVRLYTSIPLHNISLSPPAPAGATVEKLDQDKQYQTERNGQTYQVVEQHYAIFPEQPGELSIPPLGLRAFTPDPDQRQRSPFGGGTFNDSFFQQAFKNNPLAQQMMNDDFFNDPFGMGGGKQINLRSNSLQFKVGHIPAAAQGKNWLPARNVTLDDSWQGNPPQLHSGEPTTLTLTVTADGLTGEQIPAITLPDIPGVRVYNEPAKTDNRTNGEQVIGTSTQTFTLIPEQKGAMKLPEISLPWWNTQTQSMQTAKLPARTLQVAQGSGVTNPSPVPVATAGTTNPVTNSALTAPLVSTNPEKTDTLVWLKQSDTAIISISLALLLLAGSGGYWYRQRQKSQVKGNDPQAGREPVSGINSRTTSTQSTTAKRVETEAARQNCLQACAANDPCLSAKNLLEWAKQVWPQKPPVSLPELAAGVDANTAAQIRALHQHLYQPGKDAESWSGDALATALRQGLKPKADNKNASTLSDQGLPPLYPA